MSNHKAGENPARRIPKVSHATSIDVGLVGPKVRPNGVADGQQANIPAPRVYRPREEFESRAGLCSLARESMSVWNDDSDLREA